MLSPMAIGDRIRAARARLGMSQRTLAEKVGVDKSAVAQWEGGGGGKGIRTENLIETARILQIRPSELLGEETEADSFSTTDTREIALIHLYRQLSEPLKNVHLSLLYAQTGTSEPPKHEGNPRNRKRVGG